MKYSPEFLVRILNRWGKTTDPPVISLMFAFATVVVAIITIFFEPSSPGQNQFITPAEFSFPRFGLSLAIVIIWLLEIFGYIRQRIIFIIFATFLPVLLLSLGRAIVGTLYLAMVPAWVAYVGLPWQRYLSLILAEMSILILAQVYQDTSFIDWITWLIAIPFIWFSFQMAGNMRRLTVQLRDAQADLARQAMAEERRQIAMEIHDVIAHSMTIMMLHLTGARNILHRDSTQAAEALEKAEEIGRQSLADIRRTVYLLRSTTGSSSPESPLPGINKIAELVDNFRAAGLNVRYISTGDLSLVMPATGLDLYRIAQEALSNVARHAPKAKVAVKLNVGNDHTVMSIIDTGGSGKTGQYEKRQWKPGLGIQGMENRINHLGGQVVVGPYNGGWRVECIVPTVNINLDVSGNGSSEGLR